MGLPGHSLGRPQISVIPRAAVSWKTQIWQAAEDIPEPMTPVGLKGGTEGWWATRVGLKGGGQSPVGLKGGGQPCTQGLEEG